jgi:hypothetical protein
MKVRQRFCSTACARPVVLENVKKAQEARLRKVFTRYQGLSKLEIARLMKLRWYRKGQREGFAQGYEQALKDLTGRAQSQKRPAA